FSIVITFFNQAAFVKDAVESALSQSHDLREIIVVDDGSTDGTWELLAKYTGEVQMYRFPRNCGAIAARNYGATFATGEYIVFLDGDDALIEGALDIYERIITERHPTIILGQRWSFEGLILPQGGRTPDKIECITYENLMTKDRSYGTC